MEKSLKYFLSIITLIVSGCSLENTENLTQIERKELSMKIFKEGEGLRQGSPKSMTRIERAIEIDPTNSDALRELSVAYLKRGMMADWKLRYDKAVKANPEVWIPMRGYLHLFFHRDYDGAIADFNAADTFYPELKLAPQGQSVDYWRGIAFLGKKDYDAAIFNFETHISLETQAAGEEWVETTTFLYLGIAYLKRGDHKKALFNFDKMIQYNRNVTADGHFYRAKTLLALERTKEAKLAIITAKQNFEQGSFHKHDYVEVIKQIYISDITALAHKINTHE